MDQTMNYMSVQNFQHLMAIFEKFMLDRYSINIHNNPNIKIKEIFFETMTKVNEQSSKQTIAVIDLNKITLSIVKNVVKQKLSLHSLNSKNSSLTRDRDVQKNKTNTLHKINRPQPSDKSDLYSYDVNQKYDEIANSRTTTENSPFISNTSLQSNNSTDDILSNEEFTKKLNSLEQQRQTNYTTIPSVESHKDSKLNDAWLSEVYKNNNETHPKELYNASSTVGQQEHFTQPDENNTAVVFQDATYKNERNENNAVVVPKTTTKYMIIDSRDRDTTKFSLPNEYIMEFDNLIKNVLEVKFLYAQYTSSNPSEPYVNLHIQEFDVDNMSINNNFKDAFMQLPLTDAVMSISGNDFECIKTFQSPLNKLNRLHIKFTQYNGDLYPNMSDHFLKFQLTFIQSDQVIEQHVSNNTVETTYANEIRRVHSDEDSTLPAASNTEFVGDMDNQ